MKRLTVVAVLALAIACGKAPIAPTPTPAPTYSLSGAVSETAPTTATRVSGVIVAFTDGPNTNKTTITDGAGRFTLPDLLAGAGTLRASRADYDTSTVQVVVPSPDPVSVALDPTARIVTSSLSDTLGANDPICDGYNPCKALRLDLHRAGTIDCAVAWTDPFDRLYIELLRADGLRYAQVYQEDPRVPSVRAVATVPGSLSYLLRIKYLYSVRPVAFVATCSHPS